MSTHDKIDEMTLHAYVDGELDPDAIAEVEAWLATHPQDQAMVADWQRQAEQLRQMFGSVAREELPREWIAALDEKVPPPWRRWARQAAAALVLVAGGAAAGYSVAPRTSAPTPDAQLVASRAAGAYLVYTAEVRHPVEVGADQQAHLVGWLSKRLGHPLSAPDFTAIGYNLIGGRLLAEEDKPAALFMYENDAGDRVTLYAARNPEGTETAFHMVNTSGTRSFYWLDGPLKFAITGELDQDDLSRIAQAAYEQLTT